MKSFACRHESVAIDPNMFRRYGEGKDFESPSLLQSSKGTGSGDPKPECRRVESLVRCGRRRQMLEMSTEKELRLVTFCLSSSANMVTDVLGDVTEHSSLVTT